MLFSFAKGISTKDLVIRILSEEWPLSVKQVFERVKKASGQALTYQAVHKTVSSLLKEGILEKDFSGFSLNLEWIKKNRANAELLEDYYLKRQKHSLRSLKENETVNMHFSSLMDMARFIILEFLAFEDSEKKPIVCKLWSAWPPIALSDKEFQGLVEILSQKQMYQTITNTTFLDKMSGDCLEKIGVKIKFGVPCDVAADTLVAGDFVAVVHFPEVKKQFRKIAKITKILNGPALKMLLHFLFQTKTNTIVYLTKNVELADSLRSEVLTHFNEKRQKAHKTINNELKNFAT